MWFILNRPSTCSDELFCQWQAGGVPRNCLELAIHGQLQLSGPTWPISRVAASFWFSPNKFLCEKDAEPMNPGKAPSECPCELMPPPQLRPPVFLSTMLRVRSTWVTHSNVGMM